MDNGDKKLKAKTLTTHAPYDYTTLWVTAATKARKSDKYKIMIKVCGAESLVTKNGQSVFVYDYNTGIKNIDLTLYYDTDDSECPIDKRVYGTNPSSFVAWPNSTATIN